MNAQIVSARDIKGGRRGIVGQLGKGPVIGVAIIVLLFATLLASQVVPSHGSISRDANTTNLSALGSGVSTAQYYDDLMTQQDDYIHTMAARADARLTSLSDQQRFLDQNTTMWPSERTGRSQRSR